MVKPHSFSCGICHKNVGESQAAILCAECNSYVHIKCNGIPLSDFRAYQTEPDEVAWFCKQCTAALFPFVTLECEELSNLFNFDLPSFVDAPPSFEITSNLTNLPNLEDYDIDEHLPSNINSSYYSPGDLAKSYLFWF